MLYKFISIPTVTKRCEITTGDFPFYVVSWVNFSSFNISHQMNASVMIYMKETGSIQMRFLEAFILNLELKSNNIVISLNVGQIYIIRRKGFPK